MLIVNTFDHIKLENTKIYLIIKLFISKIVRQCFDCCILEVTLSFCPKMIIFRWGECHGFSDTNTVSEPKGYNIQLDFILNKLL